MTDSPLQLFCKLAKAYGIKRLATESGYAEQTVRNWVNGKVSAPFMGVYCCLHVMGYKIEVINNDNN